uniref:DUF637 domain-containing protein n=1 Tax=Aliarcobacter cryaerophilus TaxID=28198 RepID=UPI000AB9B815
SLVTAAITGNKPQLDLDSLAKSAVTAGILSYANSVLDGVENLDKVTKTVTNTTIQSGVQSVVFNTDFKDTLLSNLAMSGTNLAFENVGDYEIFKLKQGSLDFSDGSLNKILLHSLVGGTVSAIQDKDILSGILSAGFREALSPLTANSSDEAKLLASQLTGIFVGGLAGGEEGANNGYIISTSGELYNRQLHQKEVEFLKDNIENFKEYIKGKYNPVQEAIISANIEELLFQGADYWIDENMRNSIDNNTKSTPFPKEQLLKDINSFLLAQSEGLYFTDVYKEGMNSQPYFTSTQEQYKDSNWNPNSTIGLEDNSFVFIPTGKVGQTIGNVGKEVSPIIIKGTGQLYDDIGRNIYIKQQQIPIVRHFGPDEINDILNPSMPATSKIGQMYGIGFGIGNELYKLYIEKDK